MADEAEVIEQPKPSESETEARRLGWVGKEEFRGDPDKWRPAEEFLERGKTILPIVLRDNEKLQRKIGSLEGKLADLQDSTKQLVEYHTKGEQRAYERARKEIQAEIETAAANADQGAVRRGMDKLDALERPAKVEPKKDDKTAQQTDPIIQDWIAKEDWFTRDRALNAYAVDVYGGLERDKPGVSKAELLAETKKRTMEKFPEKFGINPARDNARAVAEPSGGTAGRKRGRTYEDLPAEAKAACDKFVKTIPGYKREQYLADYDWEG